MVKVNGAEKKKLVKTNNLYFGVKYRDSLNKQFQTINLFDIPRVKEDIASYIKHKEKGDYSPLSPLYHCFGSVQGRCEWEWVVDDIGTRDMNQTAEKVDIYSMYVEPNAEYLLELVNSLTYKDIKDWIRK